MIKLPFSSFLMLFMLPGIKGRHEFALEQLTRDLGKTWEHT